MKLVAMWMIAQSPILKDNAVNNELFETEYAKLHPSDKCTRMANGNYSGWLKQACWVLWQRRAELDQKLAKLNAPAKVGSAVFREGVKHETVIGAAQHHYQNSKKEDKPAHVRGSDILKLLDGEHVLLPLVPEQEHYRAFYDAFNASEGLNTAQRFKDGYSAMVQVQTKPESNAGKWYLRDLREKETGDFAKFWYQAGYGCNAGQFFAFESRERALKAAGGSPWFEPWYAPYVDSLGIKAIPKESFNRDIEAQMIKADEVNA